MAVYGARSATLDRHHDTAIDSVRALVARALLNLIGGLQTECRRDPFSNGSCVWHLIWMQTSIREWALRQGWGGRPVRQESAQGILVAALGVLVKHYGIRDTERRSA